MAQGETAPNAILGAIAIVVATPLFPLAPLIGGMVAGYLQGPDRTAGLQVGAIAGTIAFLPLLLVLVVLGNFFLVVFVAGNSVLTAVVGSLGIVTVVFGFVLSVAYIVFLAAMGGWIGSVIRAET